MADIFLDLRRVDYRSDQNILLTAWRSYADALFLTPSGGTVPFSCIVDTGAPFSVLPYSLWHDRNLSWTSLGRRLIRQGGQVSDPLKWQGEDCSLGQTSVSLIDRRTSQQTGPFFLVAKFVDRPLPDARLRGRGFLNRMRGRELVKRASDGRSAGHAISSLSR